MALRLLELEALRINSFMTTKELIINKLWAFVNFAFGLLTTNILINNNIVLNIVITIAIKAITLMLVITIIEKTLEWIEINGRI